MHNDPIISAPGGPPLRADVPPPGYTEEDQLAELTLNLNLNDNTANPVSGAVPSVDETIAHLELLTAFNALRISICEQDGLFNLWNNDVTNKSKVLLAQLVEKRWAVFVTRAADRFQAWWEALRKQSDARLLRLEDLSSSDFEQRMKAQANGKRIAGRKELPPLDVLMVWHAFKLNPRCYLEDCLRSGLMNMWYTPMPWAAIHASIDVDGLYNPGPQAVQLFEASTNHRWDNTCDPLEKQLICPHGHGPYKVPWTTCGAAMRANEKGTIAEEVLPSSDGFADPDFSLTCKSCDLTITHDTLCAYKFITDANSASTHPLPGTFLSTDGLLPVGIGALLRNPIPNKLVAAMMPYVGSDRVDSMDQIRRLIEASLIDYRILGATTTRKTRVPVISRPDRMAIRRMMTRYWDNSSPFALDLVGAVIRQGSFVEKMVRIDWLHSPVLTSTTSRLITKYTRFFSLMSTNPYQLLVPTLDVDLAWHTHQLNPSQYYTYSINTTKKFVDHDDKIADTKLSDAFAKTSELYQKQYKEPYSMCTCWYCEAIRATHTSSGVTKLFNHSTIRDAERQLYTADTPSDPSLGPHISAHGAIRPQYSDTRSAKQAALSQQLLDKALEKAQKRAKKEGRPIPQRNSNAGAEPYGAYGGVGFYPFPYMGMGYGMAMGAGGAVGCPYVANPGCANFAAGAAGNCASGTCGGGAAGGACGGGGGFACGGGGGACGGGGGGCGGGGGGCGGGGGA